MRRPRSSSSTAFLLVAVFAIAGAGPVLGAEPYPKPSQATAKPANEKEKLVCTTEEVAGSIIPKRVCRTQKQADAQLRAIEDLNRERKELGGTRTELLGMTPSGTLSGR